MSETKICVLITRPEETIATENMPEYSFSLTRYFPYKDRIVDSVFIQEYKSQRKPVFSHVLRSDSSGVALKKILFGELFGKVFMRNAIFSKVTVLMFP